MRIILVFFLSAIWCSLRTESRSLGLKSGVRELILEGLTYHSSLEPTVCQSEECRSVGHTLKASLNESVDPCDDFYEFVCGGWIDSHNIPYDDRDQEISSVKELQEKITEEIKQEVINLGSRSEPDSVTAIGDFYKSCIDIESRKTLGVKPIRDYMRTAGGWPLAGDPFDEKTFEWQHSFVNYAFNAIYQIWIAAQDKNGSRVELIFWPDSDLTQSELIDKDTNRNDIQHQKDSILEQAIRLGAKNDSQTLEDIAQIVQFQGRVAKEMANNQHSEEKKISLGQLSNGSMNWVDLFNRVYTDINSTIRVSADDEVTAEDLSYYDLMPKILSQTPKRVIANYMGWKFAKQFGEYPMSDNKSVQSQTYFQFAGETNPYGLSRLFVEKYFGKQEKEAGEALVNDIRGAFEDIMKATDWLDSKTRDSALTKLAAIRQNVGYPDWIFDDEAMNKLYLGKMDPKNFLGNLIKITVATMIRNLNSLGQTLTDADIGWSMLPYTVNAQYSVQNAITIPAGIMSYPHFRHSLPAAINYGGVGSVIGHELTHGFDTRGSEYDGTGNKTNWWTDSVRQKFNDKANCFRQEYSNTIDKQTGLHLHGNDTVGEDIADNGGIQEAFRAYQKFVKREAKLERLPVIDKYSADQQFFISMGNFYCMKESTEQLKRNIKFDEHTLFRHRINIPLSNFETFSDVFKCPVNSRMNRKNKCVLW